MADILVDTSVWIDFLRTGNPELEGLLNKNRVVTHPMIIGELACGNLKKRKSLLKLWNSLNQLSQASHEEVLYFIERKSLMGRGVGYVDVHLLASVALAANVSLWTHDKRLAQLASNQALSWD